MLDQPADEGFFTFVVSPLSPTGEFSPTLPQPLPPRRAEGGPNSRMWPMLFWEDVPAVGPLASGRDVNALRDRLGSVQGLQKFSNFIAHYACFTWASGQFLTKYRTCLWPQRMGRGLGRTDSQRRYQAQFPTLSSQRLTPAAGQTAGTSSLKKRGHIRLLSPPLPPGGAGEGLGGE
jgi:hypothetical protein